MKLTPTKIEKITHEIEVKPFISAYRNVGKYLQLCRQCDNFGRRWGCPPFDDNPQPCLERYEKVTVYMLKVYIEPAISQSQCDMAKAMSNLVQAVRGQYEEEMLAEEAQRSGRAALFTGLCPHCGEAVCARREGKQCRHPNLVRPSLEALGFNLCQISNELFGTEILWAKDNRSPEYMCLIGAVFS